MVTNERQRLYALETRELKRKSGEKPTSNREQVLLRNRGAASPQADHRDIRDIAPNLYNLAVDPALNGYPPQVKATAKKQNGLASLSTPTPEVQAPPTTSDAEIRYYVNIMQDNRRVKPKITLDSSTCSDFSSLVQHVYTAMDAVGQKLRSIKVLGPDGLVAVDDEDSWRDAILMVTECEWMDGDCKCVVEVEPAR